jgi:hypothetical protein
MLDRMSASRRSIRHAASALLGLSLVVLLGACNTSATTPQPRATIAFLVRNETGKAATYRFSGSATRADVTGPLACFSETTIGTTWDPTWTFEVNGRKAVASTDSADLQPGANARGGLTVIVVVDASGIRATDVHPGAPDAGDTNAPPSGPCSS